MRVGRVFCPTLVTGVLDYNVRWSPVGLFLLAYPIPSPYITGLQSSSWHPSAG
jgi:hypothetical protein